MDLRYPKFWKDAFAVVVTAWPIVVPLVGVDPAGRRLGMGGGFYDRALEFRRRRRYWRGPHLVGFAFDCQRTDSSFAEPWDLRLDSLATESGLQHYIESTP